MQKPMVYLRHVHQQLWVIVIAPEGLSCRLQALLPRLEHVHHAARLLLVQAAQLQQQQGRSEQVQRQDQLPAYLACQCTKLLL